MNTPNEETQNGTRYERSGDLYVIPLLANYRLFSTNEVDWFFAPAIKGEDAGEHWTVDEYAIVGKYILTHTERTVVDGHMTSLWMVVNSESGEGEMLTSGEAFAAFLEEVDISDVRFLRVGEEVD